MMLITLCHPFDLLPPITLLLLIDLLGQVHQLEQLDQQVLSLHQLSQGKPPNRATLTHGPFLTVKKEESTHLLTSVMER